MSGWINNLKLQPKLLAIFAAITLLGTISIGWYINAVNQLNLLIDKTTVNAFDTQDTVRMQTLLLEQRIALEAYLRDGETVDIARFESLLEESGRLMNELAFEGAYTGFDASLNTDLAALSEDFNALYEEGLTVFYTHQAGDLNTAQQSAGSLLATNSIMAQFENQLETFIFKRSMDFREGAEFQASQWRTRAVLFGGGALILTFLLALAAALITNSVTQPVLYLTNAVVAFENGVYRRELLDGYDDRQDEIGHMVTAFINMVDSIVESNRNKEQLLTASSRFVPEAYLDFLEKPSIVDINLGDHVSARMSVMFSDIRGFTTMSESMTPAENFDFVNTYLQRVSPSIQEHNGFIVKFLGDGMMAIFPYDVEDAIRAGLKKLAVSQAISLEWSTDARLINLGIGIHIGDMMVGMVGEEMRLQGDAFSDNVNLTARIEGLNKMFGTNLIISEEVRTRLDDPGKFHVRPLGKVQVKGREYPITLHEVFDADLSEMRDAKQSTLETYTQALALYQGEQFDEAKTRFAAVLAQNPDDRTAAFYVKQCELLSAQGVPQNWQGVIVMTTK